MKYENVGQVNFFSEMSEKQISANEFFSSTLLDSLRRNFGLEKVLIFYFDVQGKFLSWTHQKGVLLDSKQHPYRKFMENDVIRHVIYQDAVRDQLTYFNVEPRLYQSTRMIDCVDYNHSAYVRFIEKYFDAHYSITLAFGINAYIQVTFFKSAEEGDFLEEEIETLRKIYIYIANSYKNFKKHEQSKIVNKIQGEIIATGERAYLVTDDFMHVLNYNKLAYVYLKEMLGSTITDQLDSENVCSWLPFLLGTAEENTDKNQMQTRIIQNYIFKIYTYDQSYSNGIVDRYHWITISNKEERRETEQIESDIHLTKTERKVARLMRDGLTYQAIADEMVISYHTVKKHVQNIYTKCGVKSRFELYKWLEEKVR